MAVGAITDRVGRAVTGAATVEVLSGTEVQRLGSRLAGFRVSLPSGGSSARVSLDYSGFAHASGGFLASRLALFVVPACAATTPQAAGCLPVPLKGSNNQRTATLTATVPLTAATTSGTAATTSASVGITGAVVTVAAFAIPSGNAGDFTATSLAPSEKWSVGLQSGSFDWSYPIPVPPSVGGAAPALAANYDSGSVDGRTTAANGQVSMLGQGFDLPPSFIERKYQTCADERTPAFVPGGDLCWSSRISYFMSLNGASHELIPQPGVANEFRARDDSGMLVRKLTQSPIVNGDNDGEYWVVTTTDGTDFYFGTGKTPWTTAVDTNSVLRVPVYGSDAGEPCNPTWCLQAYRWQLDRVVDTHSNATAFIYGRDGNRYLRANATSTDYDRDGFLTRIEYGAHVAGGLPAGSTDPRSFVDFRVVERCTHQLVTFTTPMPACSTGPTGADYPDTPGDRICSTTCTSAQNSPSFFSTRRLARIDTSVLNQSAQSRPVDTIDFNAAFVDPDGAGTDADADLQLQSITRTGLSEFNAANPDSGLALPNIGFAYTAAANRVDTAGGTVASLKKNRLSTVTNELGGRLTITYRGHNTIGAAPAPICDQTYVDSIKTHDQDNTRECFPNIWKPNGTKAGFAWFHKFCRHQRCPRRHGHRVEAQPRHRHHPAQRADRDRLRVPRQHHRRLPPRGDGPVQPALGSRGRPDCSLGHHVLGAMARLLQRHRPPARRHGRDPAVR